MNDEHAHSILDLFMEAGQGERKSFDLGEVLDEVEGLVHRRAEDVVRAAMVISELATDLAELGVAARALRFGATSNAYLGRHDAALEQTARARRLASESGETVESARALVAGMQPLCETGRVDEAIDTGERARLELLDAGEDLLAARVDLNLGNVHKMRGDAEKALGHLDRVLETLPPDDPIRPHALNAVGECRYVLDDHAGADRAFKEALERLGEDGGFASALITGNRADVAGREGRLQDALDHFQKARRLLSDHGARSHELRLAVECAETLETAGLHDEAHAELEDAIGRIEDANMAFEHARGLFALGRLSLRKRRYRRAINHLDDASRRFRAIGNERLARRAAIASIEACLGEHRLDEAAGKLASLQDVIDGPYEHALHAHHEGLLLEAEGRLDEALERAGAACEAAAETGIRPLIVDLEARRAHLLLECDSIEEAIESGRHAAETLDGIHGSLHGSRLRAAFLASRVSAHEAWIRALLRRGERADTRLAFEITERVRNRGLVERISSQLEGTSPDQQDTPEITELRHRLNALYAALADEGFEEQRRLRTDARQAEIDALEIKLDRRLLDLDAQIDSNPASLETRAISDSLGEKTALIEFFMTGNDLITFTLVDGELAATTSEGVVPEIDRLANELHFQCRRRLRGTPGERLDAKMEQACRAILGKIHDLVIAPLPAEARDRERWLVIPMGALVGIPFHALNDGSVDLIERHIISTAPSASVAAHLSELKTSGRGTLVATVSDELAPGIDSEGEAISALYRDNEDFTRLDASDATADRLKTALAGARIAHVACHGRFLSSSPRSSGLRLHDRWLTVRDINELESAPSIVILSGCETGLHPGEGADELLGLTRGFAANGSRAVVASLWNVHDRTSTRLMTEMHRHLVEVDGDLMVSEALRSAQLLLRKEHPHPAFWAPFFCSESPVGNGPIHGLKPIEDAVIEKEM